MAEPNEVYDNIMRELNDLVLSDTEESKEQQSFFFHEEAGFDDIPPSLLSYFETSKSRAAVCEKLILEDLEDFTVSHHNEDMTNLSIGLDKDMMKLNEQVICDPENEENDISSDTRLLASTESETLSDRLCTHNVSNNDDKVGTNMESGEHLLFETRTLDISLSGEERKKMSEYEEERKKEQFEEMKMEEHKRQIERDFQEELRKIMEAEKLHQREIELMEKRAQDKLEQEFLLQQELISNLQRRVKEERRMREEEQNRMKRKREEEKVKIEAERKRMEEERKIREKEDERKREEEKVKMEAERKRKEEERRRMEEEDKRKREEEEVKMEAERKRKEEERRIRDEEQRRMKEEEDTRKREEEKVKMEAERKRKEEERRIRDEEQRRMKEEEDKRKREEEKVKMEAERKRKEEERMMMEEEDKRKREEEKVKMEAERKRQEEERRIREEEQRRMKEEEDKRKREEEKVKMEAERKRKEEETRRNKEEEIIIEEMKLKKEEEERKRMEREEKWREEEPIKIDLERRKLESEVRMMQEEQKKQRAEVVERKKKEEEEKRTIEVEEGNKIEDPTKEMEKMETERKMMIEIRLKKEDECRKRNERKDKERRVTKEIEESKERVGVAEKKKDADDRKEMAQEQMDEAMRNGDKNGNIDEEIKLERKKTEEIYRKRVEEERDRKKMVEKNTHERKTEEEERGRRQTEKMRRQRDEGNDRKSEVDMWSREENDLGNRRMEHENKTKDEQNKQEEEKRKRDEGRKYIEPEKEQNGGNVEANKEEEKSKNRMTQVWRKEVEVVKAHQLQEKRKEHSMKDHNEKKHTDKRENSSQREDSTSWSSSSLESIICPDGTEAIPQQQDLDKKINQTSARPSTGSVSLPVCLPEHTERRRLSWMKDCIPWSKLSLQNRRKKKGSVRSRRGLRRAAEAGSLTPLCPESLLQSTGWKSLQEVTTVTLEDLPGCSLSTLAQCTQLQSLSLRRCSLKSLEGINHLAQLCYVDVQENDISFINCENMICLRVLKLGHNKLTSIHGLDGAENLDVLDLSHNSITRIAGLESVRRLQRLSVDHNQLISTKGLRDVYTLLHLNCSHNHLASVEGLENSALLNTLDLRANSLTEPPSLNNQVLLRELHLDDNSISSLQSLTACWLPLLQHLSVAQNRITQLPSVSDFVSLENLDLRFNCVSELQTVCESLEGCHLLQKVHLTGNPLQQESDWRSTLQKAVPGLRVIDDQWTDSSLSPPAAQQVTLASGSFLAFCQTQLQQTHDLQQQHSRELIKASSSLDAVKISCQHFTEALQQAVDQRFAHEYGDTNVADKHRAAGQPIPEETVDMGSANADKHSECPEIESSTEKVPPVIPISDTFGYSTLDEKSAAESRHYTFNADTTRPQTGPAVSKANSGSVNSLVTKRKTNSTNLKMAPVFYRQDLDRQIAAAVMIQQLWRKYRQKCGNISSPSTAEKRGGRGGDGVKPGPGPSSIDRSVVGQDHAATVIQAFWRGFTLRRRLASALAAVTCSDSGEDDTFEEVDMDEFVFDEAALEKHWTLPLCEDSPLRRYTVSEQPLSLKPLRPFPEPSQYILPPAVERKSKQAWVAPEQVDSERQGVSLLSSNRNKSPASTSAVSGLSKRSEKILEEWGFTNHHTALLMLKRAQNMKSKKHQQKRRREPSVRLALFRNCGFQPEPVEAQSRKARHNSSDIKVRDVELGLQQAERMERVKQDQARQRLQNQAAHSDRDSESVRFLPEISSDILNGGRVQLVADPGYTERLHHASGLWANSSLTAQPCRENNYPRRNSLGHAREEVPSPRGSTSAPSIKERISFRDNPVQLSGGWGGGKKRGKVHK